MIFQVNGYWKDNKSYFENYLINSLEEIPSNYEDDDFFYFGLSEQDIKKSSQEDAQDFVIISYTIIETTLEP